MDYKAAQQYFAGATQRIIDVQRADGGVPWFEAGVLDAWNHAEAVMALNLIGERQAARHGFDYLVKTQLPDGSWRGQLGSAVPIDSDLQNFSRDNMTTGQYIRDTNSAAYIAVAVYHDYLLRGDMEFLHNIWKVVVRALQFVLAHQTSHGDIAWAAAEDAIPHDDALLASCCSIYKSLASAAALAALMQDAAFELILCDARTKLGHAITKHPHRFDRQWESKKRFAMDWYYPVLSGVLCGRQARTHLAAYWDAFVIEGYGCRCVVDEPWVTAAESAELVLALLAADMQTEARAHFDWLAQYRSQTGDYWMGFQTEEKEFWPVEKPPWTAAAILLAADAIHKLTPAHKLFA